MEEDSSYLTCSRLGKSTGDQVARVTSPPPHTHTLAIAPEISLSTGSDAAGDGGGGSEAVERSGGIGGGKSAARASKRGGRLGMRRNGPMA